jgi:hypothetical protein
MVWWQWLGVAWVTLGGGIIIGAEIAALLHGSTALISSNDWPVSILACLAVTIGWPLLVLYVFFISLRILYRGRIPVCYRVWWPSRAMKFPSDISLPHPPDSKSAQASSEHMSPETVLCRMIDLRRWKDRRLDGINVAHEWPMFMLWKTPEAAILQIVEQYYWLCDGGLSDRQTINRIDAFQFSPAISTPKVGPALHTYIADRIAREDVDYFGLGPDVLSEAIRIAETWAKAEIQKIKTDRAYPAKEWLKAQVSASQIDQERDLPFKDGAVMMVTDGQAEMIGTKVPLDDDWRRIKGWMVEGDELWTFSSPSRMGIALLRDGRPIGHLTTLRVCLR